MIRLRKQAENLERVILSKPKGRVEGFYTENAEILKPLKNSFFCHCEERSDVAISCKHLNLGDPCLPAGRATSAYGFLPPTPPAGVTLQPEADPPLAEKLWRGKRLRRGKRDDIRIKKQFFRGFILCMQGYRTKTIE